MLFLTLDAYLSGTGELSNKAKAVEKRTAALGLGAWGCTQAFSCNFTINFGHDEVREKGNGRREEHISVDT